MELNSTGTGDIMVARRTFAERDSTDRMLDISNVSLLALATLDLSLRVAP